MSYTVFSHLNVEKSALYRAILGVFVAERSRFVISLRPAEVLEALGRRAEAPPIDGAELDAALQQLRAWGNLDDTADNADAATIEEFYHRKRLYQLSAAGEAAEQALAVFDDYLNRPGELQTTALESRGVFDPDLPRHYPTINLVVKLARGEKIVSVSSCQNCRPEHYLQSGAVIAEAIARSDLRVVLLASGALSHRFNQIDWKPNHPRIFHESNVSSPENIASDKQAIQFFREGRHDLVLDRWNDEYRKIFWEGFGAHYLQMVGALGGRECRIKGTPLSDYETARGTGNIHVWFDVLNVGIKP